MTIKKKYKHGGKHVGREVDRHGKIRHYYRVGKGQRKALPGEPGSPEFLAQYAIYHDGKRRAHERVRNKKVMPVLRKAVARARLRSKQKGLEFTIDLDWARRQISRQDYHCIATGIEFDTRSRKSFMRPYIPSIDRKNSSMGYTPDNCRLVIFAFNAMVSDWGDGLFFDVAQAYIEKQSKYDHCPAPNPVARTVEKNTQIQGVNALWRICGDPGSTVTMLLFQRLGSPHLPNSHH